MTARYDWTINQGETSELVVKRADGAGSFQTDLAFSANFRGAAKDKYGGTTYLTMDNTNFTSPFTTSGSSGATEDNSTVKIILTSTQTAAIPAGKYVYDIENYDGADPPNVARILEGSLIVKAEVTT